MKYFISALWCLVLTASAEPVVVAWHSRLDARPDVPERCLIDLANPNRTNSVLWTNALLSFPTPAWFDLGAGIGGAFTTGMDLTDAAENVRTAKLFSATQRDGHKELRALKQAMGLPLKASDAKLMRVLLENSRTNSAGTAGAAATRLLSRAQSALWLQEYVKPEND